MIYSTVLMRWTLLDLKADFWCLRSGIMHSGTHIKPTGAVAVVRNFPLHFSFSVMSLSFMGTI